MRRGLAARGGDFRGDAQRGVDLDVGQQHLGAARGQIAREGAAMPEAPPVTIAILFSNTLMAPSLCRRNVKNTPPRQAVPLASIIAQNGIAWTDSPFPLALIERGA